ncbi:response regulator [Rhizobium sp. SAFR-030]|uniref:response regulator n=1 Tax=Rhizobium sp. SAFR-030 TaxID=3387277 RepID=UPI003F81FEB7
MANRGPEVAVEYDGELLQRACERINDLDLPAFIKDGALRYVAVNDAYARLRDARREQFPGHSCHAFHGFAEDEDLQEKQRRALVFGTDETARCMDAAGRLEAEVRIERFLSDDDQAYLFAVFEPVEAEAPASSAVTDLIRGGVSLDMLGSTLNLLEAGIGIFSENDELLYFNDEFADYYRSQGVELQLQLDLRTVLCAVYDHRVRPDRIDAQVTAARSDWIAERMEHLRADQWQATEPLPDGRWLRSVNKRLANGWLILLRLDVTEFKVQEMRLAKKVEETEIFRAAFEDLPVGVFLRDSQHRLVYANAAFETLTGRPREEILGLTEEEMFPNSAQRFRAQNSSLLEDGGTLEKAEEIILPDQSVIAAIARIGRISTPAGEPYIVGSITDVTRMRDAQKTAEQLHDELQAILNSLPVGVAIIDSDMRIEYVNATLDELWSLNAGSRRNWVGVAYRDFVRDNFERNVYGDRNRDFDRFYDERLALLRSAGEIPPFEISHPANRQIMMSRDHLADGKMLLSYVDMTTMRRREQEVREVRAALDERGVMMQDATSVMSQGLLILRDTNLAFLNAAMPSVLQVPAELLQVGRTWHAAFDYMMARGDFGTPEEAAEMLAGWRRQAETGAITASFHIGGERWIDLEINLSGNGNWLVVASDVTETKQREQELQRLLQRAHSADRAKSEFLANMSHEIRTPMNGVLGMAELLSKSNLDTRQKTFTDIIVKSGTALLTIINDILDSSKIEAGQMSLRNAPFDPVDAIEDVATLLSSSAAEKDIELIVRGAALHHTVLGDAGRFRQVITNLIGNAIKFTEQGHILIDIQSELQSDETMQLSVRIEDTGIGIPADQLDTIFDKFSQVDGSSTRRHEGTGLGLAITHGLIELFGGSIAVDSEPGAGSVFTVRMPFTIASERRLNEAVPQSVRNARVLVIDDNEINRKILIEQLTIWGFDCVAVESGREGIEVLRGAAGMGIAIDALILDYQMPDMNGLAVAQLIRSDPLMCAVPILFLTSMDTASTNASFQLLNIDAHLMKPARAHLLRSTLSDVIRTGRAQRRNRQAGVEGPPALPAASPHPILTLVHTSAEPGLDVLVAEDNEVNQIVFTQILQATGLKFRIVANGALAVEAWREQKPGMILMDVSMPVMNGHQAARRIREIEMQEGGHVPIVGVTAHALEADRDLCLAAGMDDYLSKPISPELLEAKIGQWRRQRRPAEASRG